MGNHHQMMMFNIFIHNLEVNMKSVLTSFGLTRIHGEVGTLARGGRGGYWGAETMPSTDGIPTSWPRGAEGSQALQGMGDHGARGAHHGLGPPQAAHESRSCGRGRLQEAVRGPPQAL